MSLLQQPKSLPTPLQLSGPTSYQITESIHFQIVPRTCIAVCCPWSWRSQFSIESPGTDLINMRYTAAVLKCGWYCTSCCITCVQHNALSPFGTNLLIWIQDFRNFFGTFKSLPSFSWYKYTEEGTNLHLPEDNPAIRKVKLLCNGNWLATLQEAGNMWKPSEQCKQNKLCHTHCDKTVWTSSSPRPAISR